MLAQSPQIPLVAIFMITYNQEAFISKAIEGVVTQKTNFSTRLYLGEDCSTDKTRQICMLYKQKYPDQIELLLSQENNFYTNIKQTYEACQRSGAKYISLCEGDDYWVDSHKLEKQVEFLEAHPECSMCFHDVGLLFEETKALDTNLLQWDADRVCELTELIQTNFIPTCSVMYRANPAASLPSWFVNVKPIDWMLHILNARYGTIGYSKESMAVYRIHSRGVWNSMRASEKYIESSKLFDEFIKDENFRPYWKLMKRSQACYVFKLVCESVKNNSISQTKKYFFVWLKKFRVGYEVSLRELAKIVCFLWLPGTYRFINQFSCRETKR